MIRMLNNHEVKPMLKRRTDKGGNQVIEVNFDNSNLHNDLPYVLQIRLIRIIHNQGHQVDAWGHSTGPMTTSIKKFALVKEDFSISTLSSSSDMADLSEDEYLTVRKSRSSDPKRQLSIILKNKFTQLPYDQVPFDTMSRHVDIIGCTDSIQVQIVKEEGKSGSKTDHMKRIANRALENCKSYLIQEVKGSSLILQRRTFKRDLVRKTWNEKGRPISAILQDAEEENFLPTLLDSPPPPYLP